MKTVAAILAIMEHRHLRAANWKEEREAIELATNWSLDQPQITVSVRQWQRFLRLMSCDDRISFLNDESPMTTIEQQLSIGCKPLWCSMLDKWMAGGMRSFEYRAFCHSKANTPTFYDWAKCVRRRSFRRDWDFRRRIDWTRGALDHMASSWRRHLGGL